ncbi:MlaD family protein [Rhodococcus sp. KRD197]|uniref:MlaD family protein n=1 Tax=unclassified Rhodococcus (in: high G+C Gram-positive bacteria) TaxID=192944 RepID=UPI0027DA7137|nr:MlaD family protein [Rhodococcus sp. KRD197]
MQPVKMSRWRFSRHASSRSEAGRRRSDVRLGMMGIVAVVVLLAAVGVVSVVRTGETTYTAELADAGSVRADDDVRVAGITVGKVESITLRPDHVEMSFTVKDGVFIGDATSLEVRMLTIVGGHYLAVLPAGTKPLAHATIPRDRVILPYNLPQLFQDAVRPMDELEGDTVRISLDSVASKLSENPQSPRALLTALDKITSIIEQQNDDVSRTLDLANEYTSALNQNLDVVAHLIDKLNLLETLIQDNKAEVSVALRLVADTLHALAPVGRAWQSTLKPQAQLLADAIPELDELGKKLGAILDAVHSLQQRLNPLIADGGVVVVPAAPCVPVPGRTC